MRRIGSRCLIGFIKEGRLSNGFGKNASIKIITNKPVSVHSNQIYPPPKTNTHQTDKKTKMLLNGYTTHF